MGRSIASTSPLKLPEFCRQLSGYPEPGRSYVLLGLAHVFHIGFEPDCVRLHSRPANLRSASCHPDIIDSYLADEVAAGCVAGPFPSPPWPHFRSSPFGVIPKPHQPGKWRLNLDLSSPTGHSVNDSIPQRSVFTPVRDRGLVRKGKEGQSIM